jgi:hypothetical protein
MHIDYHEFNINDYVYIQLTDVGRAEHKRQYDKLNEQLSGHLKEKYPYIPPEEDDDGWSQWQMWVVIQDFGGVTHIGFDPPFMTAVRFSSDSLTEHKHKEKEV